MPTINSPIKPATKSIIMLKKLTKSEETWYSKSHSVAAVSEDFLGHSIPNNIAYSMINFYFYLF